MNWQKLCGKIVGISLLFGFMACTAQKRQSKVKEENKVVPISKWESDDLEPGLVAQGQTQENENELKEKVYTEIQEIAAYPGGREAMDAFIQKTKKFPQDAVNEGIEGRVVLKLVIKKDGTVDKVEVIRSVSPSLDAEAVRVVKAMPKWHPAKINGKAVNSYFTLPISFYFLK